MGNSLTAFKKFFANKNTVTFLCLLLGVVVLYFGYNYRITKATSPIKVPYAKVAINAKTQITAEMIGTTEVPSSLIKTTKTMIENTSKIINKYSSYASGIPKNSYFYSDAIMDEKEMPDYAFKNMKDGYTVYSLKVNMNTTYANKIFPDTYIDLYAKATEDTSKRVMFTRLIESIKVKAVKDDKGKALLENGVNNGTPAAMLFEVPDDLFDLLKKAEYVDGVEIIPVPRNSAYTASQGETTIDNEVMRQFIMSKCISITS